MTRASPVTDDSSHRGKPSQANFGPKNQGRSRRPCSVSFFMVVPRYELSLSGTQSRIPIPYLRHRSGPSSQLSGPIAGFLACVEDAQRLRSPSAPFTGGAMGVCTGPDFRKEKAKIQQKDFYFLSLECLDCSSTAQRSRAMMRCKGIHKL